MYVERSYTELFIDEVLVPSTLVVWQPRWAERLPATDKIIKFRTHWVYPRPLFQYELSTEFDNSKATQLGW